MEKKFFWMSYVVFSFILFFDIGLCKGNNGETFNESNGNLVDDKFYLDLEENKEKVEFVDNYEDRKEVVDLQDKDVKPEIHTNKVPFKLKGPRAVPVSMDTMYDATLHSIKCLNSIKQSLKSKKKDINAIKDTLNNKFYETYWVDLQNQKTGSSSDFNNNLSKYYNEVISIVDESNTILNISVMLYGKALRLHKIFRGKLDNMKYASKYKQVLYYDTTVLLKEIMSTFYSIKKVADFIRVFIDYIYTEKSSLKKFSRNTKILYSKKSLDAYKIQNYNSYFNSGVVIKICIIGGLLSLCIIAYAIYNAKFSQGA